MVRFGREVSDWPKVSRAIQDALKHADAIRYRIVHHMPEIVQEANRLIVAYEDLGMDSRDARATAALTAGWKFWGVDESDVYSQSEKVDTTDATDALLDILALRYRLERGGEKSLLELLSNPTRQGVLSDLYGLRYDEDKLMVAIGHRGLRNAMSRTAWGQSDLRRLLLQLPRASVSKNPLRFGSQRKRAVVIPHDTLIDIGVDIYVMEPEPEDA